MITNLVATYNQNENQIVFKYRLEDWNNDNQLTFRTFILLLLLLVSSLYFVGQVHTYIHTHTKCDKQISNKMFQVMQTMRQIN